VLSAQKARIDELHKIVRAEANALFTMMLLTKNMPKSLRSTFRKEFNEYIQACAGNKLKKAEKEYEDIISFCISHKGASKDTVDKLLAQVVANQQNRTNFYLQMGNKVYSNEWMIMCVLFSITLTFVLLIDAGEMLSIRVVTALLCTGISMLMLNLVKLNSLTHKKAKQIWAPFITLMKTNYYRIDEQPEED
jgi:intergrase/recombinase